MPSARLIIAFCTASGCAIGCTSSAFILPSRTALLQKSKSCLHPTIFPQSHHNHDVQSSTNGGAWRLFGRRGGGSDGKKKDKKPSKSNLPEKDCVVCGRPFTWRKKWERCWDEVTCCSKSCNAKRRSMGKD